MRKYAVVLLCLWFGPVHAQQPKSDTEALSLDEISLKR